MAWLYATCVRHDHHGAGLSATASSFACDNAQHPPHALAQANAGSPHGLAYTNAVATVDAVIASFNA